MGETKIHLPTDLPYPIKITSLSTRTSDNVQRGQRLLNYSYLHLPTTGGDSETRIGTWDATFEGNLQAWKLKPGDVVTRRRAKEEHALVLYEECQHGIQVNGMCAICGMDMDHFDYTGRPESSRANIQMTHSSTGPVVSLEEAQRIERETAEHLLKSRKLSLIVDLDQTIVHATVDPTVGEWIEQSEAWEKRQATKKAAQESKDKEKDEDDSDDSDSESDDEYDPNWDALQDIKKFRLATEFFDPFGRRANLKGKGRASALEMEGCLYYIKPRPGWKEFLTKLSQKYEMHVYTMGTRAYAEQVCAAIDPDGKIFGGRVLSRDESGSLTQKSLRRLFPSDTSMVVIIDDRADVWDWSPNLVKVVPYDFFVGIGDINSTFLPTQRPLTPTDPSAPGGQPRTPLQLSPKSPLAASVTVSSLSTVPSSPSVAADTNLQEITPEELAKDELITQNFLALEAQVEERPLAKAQEELLRSNSSTDSDDNDNDNENDNAAEDGKDRDGKKAGSVKQVKQAPKLLLSNEDYELIRVGDVLDTVHRRFFDAHDARTANKPVNRRNSLGVDDPSRPDVRTIIRDIRLKTFAGCHILFSGVIPTNTIVDYEQTEIWSTARAFGAVCHKEFTPEVTHLVTSKRGTQKVELAQREQGVFIVWFSWFTDSVAQCRRQDERPYQLEQPSGANVQHPPGAYPPSDPSSDSFDMDSEETEDEERVSDPTQIQPSPPQQSEQQSQVQTQQQRSGGEGGSDGVEVTVQMVTDPDADVEFEDQGEMLDLAGVDWQDVNDEVDAAMMESDSEESNARASDIEVDGTPSHGATNGTTPPQKRKRLVSLTPTDSNRYLGSGPSTPTSSSRPTKRAKDDSLASDRPSLPQLTEVPSPEERESAFLARVTTDVPLAGDDGDDDDSDEEEEEEEEEDFLAGELEEEEEEEEG